MKQLIKSFGDSIIGVLSGFDRIVFQGRIVPIGYQGGAEGFFSRRRILFKDASAWVQEKTRKLVSAVEAWSLLECGEKISFLRSPKARKDVLARQRQQEKEISAGPLGVWACVEPCLSFKLAPGEHGPILLPTWTQCKHLYLYLDHPEYGFMSVRMQTWFPYLIQIAMNGREWLARQLEHAGIAFQRCGNKLLHIDDFEAAQQLLDQQLKTNWCSLLDGFVPIAFPTITETIGRELSYSWTLWQSEWATDLVFANQTELEKIMSTCVQHAFIGGHPSRLLSYFGRPLTKAGLPWVNCSSSLKSTIKEYVEGVRVRHWVDTNSIKMYNEFNVLRLETTINDPGVLRGLRRKHKAPVTATKESLPLRKSVADTTLRAHACQQINNRFADHLASMHSSTPVGDVIALVTQRKRKRRRSVRALEPTAKDRDLITAIADPRFIVGGLSNKDLRELLANTGPYLGKTDKQRSGITSRSIRLLRDHGVLRKLPKRRRYQLTSKGRQLVTAIQAALAASTEELMAKAA